MWNMFRSWLASFYAHKELDEIVSQFDKTIGHLENYHTRVSGLVEEKQAAQAALHDEIMSHLDNVGTAIMIKENLKTILGRS